MRRRNTCIFLAACLLLPRLSQAWLRPHYEDAQIAARSTLIVVGHLKAGTVQYVEHKRAPGVGASHEFHATLVITQTLKGKATAQEIPIILYYGLDVLQSGKMNTPNGGWNLGDNFPKDSIQIVDSGSSAPGDMLSHDASKDDLWFLQQRAGRRGDEKGDGDYGIADPEEIQPVALQDYFQCYLAADAEAAVKAYAAKHADVAPRTVRYLDHVELRRIALVTDARQRVQRLLPIFERGCWWEHKDEAQELMVAAGAEAGPALVPLFGKPGNDLLRSRILEVWSKTHYTGAVDTLLKLLQENDTFWAAQKLDAGWWNKDVESAATRERRQRYGDVLDSVRALGELADERARGALEKALAQWQGIPMQSPQMTDALREALQKLDARRR